MRHEFTDGNGQRAAVEACERGYRTLIEWGEPGIIGLEECNSDCIDWMPEMLRLAEENEKLEARLATAKEELWQWLVGDMGSQNAGLVRGRRIATELQRIFAEGEP